MRVTLPETYEWGTFITADTPVMRNGEDIGVWGADFDMGYILDLKRMVSPTELAQIALAVSLLLSGAVAAAFALIVSSSLIKPIREFKNAAQTLAKNDLTKSFTMKGRDELAQMSQTLNQAQEGIKKLIVSKKINGNDLRNRR